ncbi:MAG: right-handed parallel beta-helix repeat-containing protein [Armatimonadota bacterium]|nr:right-handed parallel beta-helix repeat-containing protein [Armatimonadota bacterium]
MALFGAWAEGAERYVAPDGSPDNDGTRAAPWSLAQANTAAGPGDVLLLLPGSYDTPLAPAASGEPGNPITFRAVEEHQAVLGAGPTARIAAIDVSQRGHIVIEGMAVRDVKRFIVAIGSHHITISNCWFESGSGWESCRFRESGDSIRLLGNVFRNGTDLVSIEGGRFHHIESNLFDRANHTCLTLMAVENSVIRRNTFRNDLMKLVEVFAGREGRPVAGRPTRHTLFEGNHFAHTADYTKSGSSSVCMTLSGKSVIVRRNLVTDCQAGFYLFLNRGNIESNTCEGNRICHNVVYGCGHGGAFKYNGLAFIVCGTGATFGDNIAVNNVIFGNRHADGRHFQGFPATTQIGYHAGALPKDLQLFSNVIVSERPSEPVIASITSGRRQYTLAEFEHAHPAAAAGNVNLDPGFVDADNYDFRLRDTSPCIDAGRPLTTAVEAGQGTLLRVGDATWFTDGYGVIEGDMVRVGEQRARVVQADYAAGTLTLDEPLRWTAGSGVSLDYHGKAPDIGAVEMGH